MKTKILIILIVLIGLGAGGIFTYKNIFSPKIGVPKIEEKVGIPTTVEEKFGEEEEKVIGKEEEIVEKEEEKSKPEIEIQQQSQLENKTIVTAFNEQDYPEILAQINQAKAEINRVTNVILTRTNNVQLSDCRGEVCFLDAFQISQENAHLDCQGKIMKPKKNDTYFGLIISSNNVSIVNCKFESFKSAIKVQSSENMIMDNTITNNPEGGIIIEGDHNFIFNNNMHDNKRANVHIEATSKRNIIYNNTMVDTEGLFEPYSSSIGAISVSGSDNIIIENIIKNNAEIGIKVSMFAKNEPAPSKNIFARNILENNGVLGLEITGAVVGAQGSGGLPESPISEGENIVFNNTLAKSKNEFGLRIRWSNNNKIIGNIIRDNNWAGISAMATERNLFEKNIISDNKQGIWLGSSDSNGIRDNIIANNTEHCAILFTDWLNDTSTNNTFKNNLLTGNGNIHDDKQICDDDHNLIFENEFE